MGVEILEAKDKEEYFVMEEAKLYVIIVGDQEILSRTMWVLQRNVYIANILIILSNNVRGWLQSGRIEIWEIQIHHRIPIQTPIRIFRKFMLNQGNHI